MTHLADCGKKGEKAHKALNDYWSWIDAYMRGEHNG